MVEKVECQVLGPVSIVVNGEAIKLNRRRERRLLALLLLDVRPSRAHPAID